MNIDKLEEIMKQKNMTKYRLSQLTGISTGRITEIFNGKTTDPRISTVKAIAEALEVEITEII